MTVDLTPLYRSLFIHNAQRTSISAGITTGIFLSSALLSTSSLAVETQDDMPSAEFSEITVTATRAPTRINNTIAQTRYISNEEIKKFDGDTALEIIRRQPGFNITQNGDIGTASNFYLRGYDSGNVLILIDGIRYGSLSLGTPALNLLPAEQIDHIEVLYGASGTSIYGADAVGGVIQIFTKGQDAQYNQASVTAGAGSNDHYLYGASAQFVNDNGTQLALSASHNETKGYSATTPANSYNYNSDDDGFESNNYSLALSHQFNNEVTVGVKGLYSDSETDFDSGESKAYSKQKNGAANAYVDWRYAPDSSLKLTYGESKDELDTTSQYPSTFETTQKQLNLVGYQSVPFGQVVYGAEHLRQELDSTDYSADDRKITSGFLGYNVSYNQFDAQLNVRHDDFSDFDNETTYNVGAAYRFTPELRLGANYAEGYHVPSFNQLYYPNYGSEDLGPESSDNYEVFISYDTDRQSTRLTGYRNNVDDMITYISTPTQENPYAGELKNIDEAKVEGISLTSDWYVDNYLFGFSYDYQKSKDNSNYDGRTNSQSEPIDFKGNYLPNRPKNKGMVYLGYQLPNLDMRVEYQYVDEYYSDYANSTKVDDYGLVNISGNYQLTPNLSMSARINNLFNKDYQTVPNYNQDGTNFFTSLTYTWK